MFCSELCFLLVVLAKPVFQNVFIICWELLRIGNDSEHNLKSMRSIDAHNPRAVNHSANGCLAARGQEMSVRILFNMSFQPSRWASEFLIFHTAGWFYTRGPAVASMAQTHTQHKTHNTHRTTHDTRLTVHTVHRTRTHSTQHTAQHTHAHIKHKIGRHGQPHNRICCTTHCKSDLSFEQEAAVRRGLCRHRAKDVSAAIELVFSRDFLPDAGTKISQLLMLDVHDPTA